MDTPPSCVYLTYAALKLGYVRDKCTLSTTTITPVAPTTTTTTISTPAVISKAVLRQSGRCYGICWEMSLTNRKQVGYVDLQVDDFVWAGGVRGGGEGRGRGRGRVAISANASKITQKNTDFSPVVLALQFLSKRQSDEYQRPLKIK